MSPLIRRLVIGAAGAVLATSLLALPAVASSGDRGATVVCGYHYRGDYSRYWGGILKHIDVSPPPRMFALNGATANVGWRFLVERYRFDNSSETWRETYRSPIQTASASSTDPAAFTPMGVNVDLPRLAPGDSSYNQIYYRVSLKLFWYRADGSVQQIVTHQMVHYQNWLDGEYAWSDKGDWSCPGGHSDYVDGA